MTPADTLTPAELERMEAVAKAASVDWRRVQISVGGGMRGTEAVAAHITIFDAPGVLVLISRIRTLEAERDALRAAVKEAEGALDNAHTSLRAVSGYLTQPIMALDARTRVKEIDETLAKLRSLPPADGGA